jgi:hypothetical protein
LSAFLVKKKSGPEWPPEWPTISAGMLAKT